MRAGRRTPRANTHIYDTHEHLPRSLVPREELREATAAGLLQRCSVEKDGAVEHGQQLDWRQRGDVGRSEVSRRDEEGDGGLADGRREREQDRPERINARY